jgi:hypothetical protein
MLGAALHLHPEDLQYGGACFREASAFVRGALRCEEATQRYPLLRGPIGAWALLCLISRLPRLTVSLTDARAGRVIDAYLRNRRRGIRSRLLAQGVLALPQKPEHYLSGRHRQAVRTNVSRAAKEGIQCTPLPAHQAVRRLAARRLVGDEMLDSRSNDDEWLIAYDRDGNVVGGALVTVDRDWAMLNILAALSYPVRYALHTNLVLMLGSRGVGHLFVTGQSALMLPDGLQYLQRILGYRVVNLHLAAAGR